MNRKDEEGGWVVLSEVKVRPQQITKHQANQKGRAIASGDGDGLVSSYGHDQMKLR